MNKIELDFSFRRDISQIKKVSTSTFSSSLPKEFSSCALSSLSNTSRFEEKKVLRKLKEQDVLNRITDKMNKFKESDEILKEVFKFRPVKSRRGIIEKENR